MNAFLVAVGPLSILVQKVVETIRHAFDPNGKAPSYVWNILPFIVGVGTAAVVKANFASLLPLANLNVSTNMGYVLTGLGLGAVAGGWEHGFDLVKAAANAKRSTAAAADAQAAVTSEALPSK